MPAPHPPPSPPPPHVVPQALRGPQCHNACPAPYCAVLGRAARQRQAKVTTGFCGGLYIFSYSYFYYLYYYYFYYSFYYFHYYYYYFSCYFYYFYNYIYPPHTLSRPYNMESRSKVAAFSLSQQGRDVRPAKTLRGSKNKWGTDTEIETQFFLQNLMNVG